MNSFLISSSMFGLPVVQTQAANKPSPVEESNNKIKPSSIPLYPEPEK